MKSLKNFFIFLNIILFIATVMSYLAPYINPTKAWIFSFFATAYFWMLICNILFMGMWAVLKNKIWLLSFLAILLGVQHIGSYLGMSITSAPSDQDISIMSYNVGKQAFPKDKQAYADYNKEFTSFMTSPEKPSILCLQEAGWFKFYRDSLAYPYAKRAGSLVILSEYEIKDQGVIKFEKSANRLVWADVQIQDQILRVVNIHLQSNKITDQAEDLVNNADLIEKKTWVSIKSVIGKIKRATSIRTQQTHSAKKFITESPYPTIVIGDFNDTPLSYTYRHIAQHLKDAFMRKGNGIGITYGGIIPGLRIDYVLGNEDIQFKSYSCPKVDYSDHYPIICRFDIARTSEQ